MSKLVGVIRDNRIVINTTVTSGGRGPQGHSAYDLWLGEGNTGTMEDYLSSLKGEKGDTGEVSQGEFEDYQMEQVVEINKLKTSKADKKDLVALKDDYVQQNLQENMMINVLPNSIKSEFRKQHFIKRVSNSKLEDLDFNAFNKGVNTDEIRINKRVNMSEYGSYDIRIRDSVILGGFTIANSGGDRIENVNKFYALNNLLISVRLEKDKYKNIEEVKADLLGIDFIYQLKEPIEVSYSKDMTPNTREIIRLNVEINTLKNAIIELGGTI